MSTTGRLSKRSSAIVAPSASRQRAAGPPTSLRRSLLAVPSHRVESENQVARDRLRNTTLAGGGLSTAVRSPAQSSAPAGSATCHSERSTRAVRHPPSAFLEGRQSGSVWMRLGGRLTCAPQERPDAMAAPGCGASEHRCESVARVARMGDVFDLSLELPDRKRPAGRPARARGTQSEWTMNTQATARSARCAAAACSGSRRSLRSTMPTGCAGTCAVRGGAGRTPAASPFVVFEAHRVRRLVE
jgi:hypothetical protein